MQGRELIQQVVSRAREDAAFRSAVEADPRGAVEREFGVSLPAGVDVEGIRDRITSRFGAAPTDAELNDTELEAVAGGMGCDPGQIEPKD